MLDGLLYWECNRMGDKRKKKEMKMSDYNIDDMKEEECLYEGMKSDSWNRVKLRFRSS